MEKFINMYYENNAKKLHKIVDKILRKFGGISGKDIDDFYSLANEVFVDVLKRYDNSQSFDGFLYSCLSNKIKTEMTRRNRQKRQADRITISIDTPIGDDSYTLADVIADKEDVEDNFFKEREEGHSEEMCNYLSKLSELQKEVLRLISIGFSPSEIFEELHINQKMYKDCYNAIHAYRNISLLF